MQGCGPATWAPSPAFTVCPPRAWSTPSSRGVGPESSVTWPVCPEVTALTYVARHPHCVPLCFLTTNLWEKWQTRSLKFYFPGFITENTIPCGRSGAMVEGLRTTVCLTPGARRGCPVVFTRVHSLSSCWWVHIPTCKVLGRTRSSAKPTVPLAWWPQQRQGECGERSGPGSPVSQDLWMWAPWVYTGRHG